MTRSLLFAAACLCVPLHAAPDSVDAVFAGAAGQVFKADEYGGISSVLVQPDGRILFGSNEMPGTVGGTPLQIPLIRFNPDGSVDNTFFADNQATGSDSGIYYDGSGWPEVHALGLLSDGKIVAAGVMEGVRTGTYTSPGIFLQSKSIVRFNPDGTIDTSFQTAGTWPWPTGGLNYIEEVVIQPDDKIIAVGGFSGFRDSSVSPIATRHGIARLNVNGSVDTSFAIKPSEFGVPAGASLVRGFFGHAALDPSGKIYVTGVFEWGNSFPAPKVDVVARLFPDGSRDFSFNPTLPANLEEARGVVVEPDGKVVVLGQFKSPATNSWLVRLDPDGTPDPSFTLDPSLGIVTARPLQRDPSGKYLLGTGPGTQDHLVRVLANGSIDPTFDATALWTDHPTATPQAGYFGNFTTAPNGKIFSGSAFDSVNGTPTVKVVAFEGDPLAAGLAWSSTAPSVVENAGSITLSVVRTGPLAGAASVNFATSPGTADSGDFTAISGTLTWPAGTGGAQTLTIPIAQDSANEGSEAFSVTLSGANGAPISGTAGINVTLIDDEAAPVIVSQPSPLTVKEGQPATFSVLVSSPVPATYQWKKNGDDIPGATAASYSIASAAATDAADYSVVVTTPAGSVPSGVASLTVVPPAAAPEPGFTFTGVTTPASFSFLADGSLLVLDGTSFAGYTLRKLDGTNFTADGTFSVTTTPASGYTATNAQPNPLPLPNGQFLATGFFSQINGVTRNRLARLDASGVVDPIFVPFFNGPFTVNGFSANFSGLAGVHVGQSGTVYVLVKTSNQGNRLFRLLSDGSADSAFSTAFNYSTNANFTAMAELPDGSILIGYTGGGFGSFERGIRRVLPDGTFDAAFPRFDTTSSVVGILPLDDSRFAAIHGNLLTIHNLANGALLETHTFAGALTSIQPYRGRLLLTGVTAFNGTPLPGLALFSLDGTVDDNFPGGAGPNANVVQATIDSQGRILVRGSFTTWNGISTPGIARLIVDRPEVGFAASAATHMENEGPLAVQIVRYGNTGDPASVRVTTSPGTATSPADFAAIDQIVSWAAGDASTKTVSLSPVDDGDIEGDESLTLQLSDVSGAILAGTTFSVTLRDDDSLPQITTQPADTFAVLGKAASLGVTATSPTAISYQWFLDGAPISGATSATYNIASASAADEGIYTIRLTNDYGTVWSAEADLVLIPDPAALAPGFAGLTLNNNIVALDVAPDGGAVIVGTFTDAGGNTAIDSVAKVTPTGALDPSFVPPVIGSGSVLDVALQPDGKVVIVGSFYTVGGVSLRGMARLNANGSLDTDFAANISSGTNGTAYAVDILPDGRIVFCGQFGSWNGQNVNGYGAVRVNANGTFSAAFGTGTFTRMDAILALPDGRVLMAADTTSSSAVKVYRIGTDFLGQAFPYSTGRTRVDAIDLAADGDYLFVGNGQALKINPDGTTGVQISLSSAAEIAGQRNGKFLVAGGTPTGRPVRYLANGTVDPAFSPGTGFNSTVNDFGVRLDGKIWAGGVFTSYNGTPVSYLALLNGDPIPLAITVQPAALTIVDPGEDVALTVGATGTTALSYQWFKNGVELSDGPGVSGSQTATLSLTNVDDADGADYTVEVSNEAGTEPSDVAQVIVLGAPEILSLSGDVSMLEGGPLTLEVEALGAGTLGYQWFRNGTLLPTQTSATLNIAPTTEGDTGSYTVEVSNTLGITPAGPVQVTILPNEAAVSPGWVSPSADNIVYTILPISGGRALVGGQFSAITDGVNNSGPGLAVVNEDGSVVPVAGLSATGIVRVITRQSDGKFLLGGAFSAINGEARNEVARLNEDFSLDTSFTPAGVNVYGAVRDIREEAGGTIIGVGEFGSYNNLPGTPYAFRLTSTGAHDPSFTSSASSWVTWVRPQSDGSLVLGGRFSDWAGVTTADYLTRTNASGTSVVGNAFPISFFYNRAGTQLANGDLLFSQDFGSGVRRHSLDGTFVQSFATNGNTNTFAETQSGAILFGGTFSAFNGANRASIARVLADGNNDPAFDPGTGFNASVETIAIADSGRIWVGGNFTSYNGATANRLILLKGAVTPPADPFATFVAGLPEGLRGENADADGDGWPNLVEFLFGTDPGIAGAAPTPLPTGSPVSGSNLNATHGLALDPAKTYRLVEVELPTDLMGLDVGLEASQDLGFTGDATATEVGTPTPNGSTETRRYVIQPAIEDASTLFWRLRVTR